MTFSMTYSKSMQFTPQQEPDILSGIAGIAAQPLARTPDRLEWINSKTDFQVGG